jgi:hypothetical protein
MTPTLVTRVVCILGVLLHVYQFSLASGADAYFLRGVLLLLSCVPYAIAWVLAASASWRWSGLGVAVLCLLADGMMHYAVFIAPQTSTAGLGLVALPLWNLLATAPLGAALGWLANRWLERRS